MTQQPPNPAAKGYLLIHVVEAKLKPNQPQPKKVIANPED